jgi:hypothetical protein
MLFYRTFDFSGWERIRLREKPSAILLNDNFLQENPSGEGYQWQSLETGGLLTVRREKGNKVLLLK